MAHCYSPFAHLYCYSIAYYGVLDKNFTVAYEAYNQIKLYREILRDSHTNLWRHITFNGEYEDPNAWGTGIGFVAGGMLRSVFVIEAGR